MPQADTPRKDISNPAKLLRALIHATGITDCKQLSEMLAIPVRTLQRLKLEVAETVDTATANDAKHAISGAATSAISGVSTANDAISGATGASPSRACIELPSEVLITEEKKEDSSLSEVPSDQCVKEKPVAKARRRFAYSDEFEAFWTGYPDKSNNSKPNAHREWMLLLPAERELAAQGLTHLAAHCRKNPDYRCVHAERYLKTRRWESYDMRPKVVPLRPSAPPPISDEEIFLIANGRAYQ
jgi:hypothetical protein